MSVFGANNKRYTASFLSKDDVEFKSRVILNVDHFCIKLTCLEYLLAVPHDCIIFFSPVNPEDSGFIV